MNEVESWNVRLFGRYHWQWVNKVVQNAIRSCTMLHFTGSLFMSCTCSYWFTSCLLAEAFFVSCRFHSAQFLITQINSESFFYCSLQLLLHRAHRLWGWPDHHSTFFFFFCCFLQFRCWWGKRKKKLFFAKRPLSQPGAQNPIPTQTAPDTTPLTTHTRVKWSRRAMAWRGVSGQRRKKGFTLFNWREERWLTLHFTTTSAVAPKQQQQRWLLC